MNRGNIPDIKIHFADEAKTVFLESSKSIYNKLFNQIVALDFLLSTLTRFIKIPAVTETTSCLESVLGFSAAIEEMIYTSVMLAVKRWHKCVGNNHRRVH